MRMELDFQPYLLVDLLYLRSQFLHSFSYSLFCPPFSLLLFPPNPILVELVSLEILEKERIRLEQTLRRTNLKF